MVKVTHSIGLPFHIVELYINIKCIIWSFGAAGEQKGIQQLMVKVVI